MAVAAENNRRTIITTGIRAFAECFFSGTRQSPALGNELVYRVQHTRYGKTLGKNMFAEWQTLGKGPPAAV
jgi:hypothetical protein